LFGSPSTAPCLELKKLSLQLDELELNAPVLLPVLGAVVRCDGPAVGKTSSSQAIWLNVSFGHEKSDHGDGSGG
jgi:hypothetical protein